MVYYCENIKKTCLNKLSVSLRIFKLIMKKTKRKCGAQTRFSAEDDEKLINLVHILGITSWRSIASNFENKTPKQCRDRWNNYANPGLNHGDWKQSEDQLILSKYEEFGAKWLKIATFLKCRSPNDTRYRWLKLNAEKKAKTKKKHQISPNETNNNISSGQDNVVEEVLKKIENDVHLIEMSINFNSDWP